MPAKLVQQYGESLEGAGAVGFEHEAQLWCSSNKLQRRQAPCGAFPGGRSNLHLAVSRSVPPLEALSRLGNGAARGSDWAAGLHGYPGTEFHRGEEQGSRINTP